ncbi:MAG: threonine synthase [Robiginitomaculum sp.]|nr:threonine synthase [Robiginitomaculum sp.]
MKFISTRNQAEPVTASQAILAGIAPDGGLYVPQSFPQFTIDDFSGEQNLSAIAAKLLGKFFVDDQLAEELPQICQNAFDFPVPVKKLDDGLSVLELFHGPTAAFKDFGARFLAQCFDRIATEKKRTILVATSGDTGGAVGCAFEHSSSAKVVILYPKGRVSPLQQQQLTCWGDNVTALQVDGDFDDCQRLVKAVFVDESLQEKHNLASANSINIARLLPQMSYYADTALRHFKASGQVANFIIPTGNMGNGMACLWARACGLPIGEIVFASNANHALFDYFAAGIMKSQPSITTLANAMDVGNPSNFERFVMDQAFAKNTSCQTISDQQIKQSIISVFNQYEQIWCPHTACGFVAWQNLPEEISSLHWHLVATADAYKFKEIVEPLIGEVISTPASLLNLQDRSSSFTSIKPQLSALAEVL